MKNAKRMLALLLTLCMVIPMCLVSVVSAEAPAPHTVTYDFTGGFTASGIQFHKEQASVHPGWWANFTADPPAANAFPVCSNNKLRFSAYNNFNGFILESAAAAGDYFAFVINNPGENADYKLTLHAMSGSSSASGLKVYVIPTSEITVGEKSWSELGYSDFVNSNIRTSAVTSAIGSYLKTDVYYIDTVNLYSDTTKPTDVKIELNNSYTVSSNEQYVVAFKVTSFGASASAHYTCVQGMTWTEKVDEYDITVDESCKDKVSVTHEKAAAGEVVTITATPDAGYKAIVTVKDKDNNDVSVENGQFTMPPSAVSVSAVFVRDTVNYPVAPLSYDFSMGLTGSNVDVSKQFAAIYSNYKSDDSDVNSLFVGQGSSVADASGYRASINFSPYKGLYMPSRIDLSDSDNPVYGFAAVMIKAPSYAGNYKIEINYWDNPNNTNACRVYMIPASEVQVTVGTYTGPINGVTSAAQAALRTGGAMSSGVAAALDDQYLVGTVDLKTDNADKTLKPLYVGHQDLEAEEYVVVFQAVATSGDANTDPAYITVDGMTLTETFGETYFTQDGEEKYFESADEAVKYINALNAETTVKLSTSITTALSLAVNADVTLDLNGNNLSVDYVTAFGQIKDSATDDNDGSRGVLTTALESNFNPDNDYFPLRVDTNKYSFYKVTAVGLGTREGATANDRVYGFRLSFADKSAYALLGTDGNGLTVEVNLYVGEDTVTAGYEFKAVTVQQYLANEGETGGADEGRMAALILTVKNIHVAAGQEVRVKMTFKLDNTYSAFASVRYTPDAVTE